MFRLNKITKTNTGREVMPYAVTGDVVSCFDVLGRTVYVNLTEFKIKKRKTTNKDLVTVVGYTPPPVADDTLFNANAGGFMGGIYEEKPNTQPVIITETKEVENKIITDRVEIESEEPEIAEDAHTTVPVKEVDVEPADDFYDDYDDFYN